MYQQTSNARRLSFWRTEFQVRPNQIGYLYNKNKFEKKLEPGIYELYDPKQHMTLILLPQTNRTQTILNQEVLTKDNVALRFSYFVEYRISDPDLFLKSFDVHTYSTNVTYEAEQLIHNLSQVHIRRLIAEIESEDLNEKRNDILTSVPADLRNELAASGVEVVKLLVRDLTFPKSIQDLFAKHLEAKIRAKSDLENARTAVAVARATKNAAEMMKDDENLKFIQYLETITKIAEKGKHTFIIGDVNTNTLGMKK
jgi:regulator of protease activity HflC (stomatin/prohibitin superfamily)